SPITSDLIVSGMVGLGQIALDGEDIYWVELRPAEGGRSVVVRRTPDGRSSDVTPVPFNVRTRVHEYGGGAFTVSDGTLYFVHFADQRLYRQPGIVTPQPLTPTADLRYADAVVDRRCGRIICVCEDHMVAGREAVNTLAGINLANGDRQVLVSGNDFYSSPRLSPDSSRLAWLTWNHPNMPWDGTELWLGKLTGGGSIDEAVRIAGGTNESIFQPEWSPDGVVYFIYDRSGLWNIYRWRNEAVEPVCPTDAEFGQPQWVFASTLYGFASERGIVCSYARNGRDHVAILDATTREIADIELPFTAISQVRVAG